MILYGELFDNEGNLDLILIYCITQFVMENEEQCILEFKKELNVHILNCVDKIILFASKMKSMTFIDGMIKFFFEFDNVSIM